MDTQLANTETPKVMQISLYSNIKQKLNFLQQCIKNDNEADTAKLYIECSADFVEQPTGEIKEIKSIRLSTDFQAWTELGIFDQDGDILEISISVNLYDMYNIINSCTDDIVSLWIDSSENGHVLVINSYYNPQQDYDELEARLNIIDYGFDKIPYVTDLPQKKIGQIRLDNIALWHIGSELNTERRTDTITCYVHNGELSFQSDYHGLQTTLRVKHLPPMQVEDNFSFTIPFHAFSLMCSTGKIDDLCFDIYEEQVTVRGDGYDFCVPKIQSPQKVSFNPDDYTDYFVIESKLAQETFELLNRLNKPCPISTVTIEQVDKVTADFTVEYEGRYSISLRPNLAMLSDAVMSIDGDILQEIFTNTNVDAIRVKTTSDNSKLFITYDNGVIEKHMMYDHVLFSEYRKSTLKK